VIRSKATLGRGSDSHRETLPPRRGTLATAPSATPFSVHIPTQIPAPLPTSPRARPLAVPRTLAGTGRLGRKLSVRCVSISAMTGRFVPYAATPGRALFQAAVDLSVLLWILLWYSVAKAVHTAISAIAEVGADVRSGADGISSNLDGAGDSAGGIPLAGDALAKPLNAAADAAQQIADAGQGLDERATTLAVLLALAVAVPPVLAVVVPWLLLRWRFARRAGATAALARTDSGTDLLALRALSNRPTRKLLAVADDPLEGWRTGDPEVVAALAALELRSCGLRPARRPAAG